MPLSYYQKMKMLVEFFIVFIKIVLPVTFSSTHRTKKFFFFMCPHMPPKIRGRGKCFLTFATCKCFSAAFAVVAALAACSKSTVALSAWPIGSLSSLSRPLVVHLKQKTEFSLA